MALAFAVGGACSGGGGARGGSGGAAASGGHGQAGSGGVATGGVSAGGTGGGPAGTGGTATGMAGQGGRAGSGAAGAGGAAGSGALASGGAGGGGGGHASGGGGHASGGGGSAGSAGGAAGRAGGGGGGSPAGTGGNGGTSGNAGRGGGAGTGEGGAGGAPATCAASAAANFVNDVVPCPSTQTCTADRLGRAWSAPVRIDDGTACAAGAVQVVLATGGAGLVAWSDSNPARVRARRFTDPGWSAVEDAGAGWGSTLRLARSITGDAMLISTDARHVRASASVQQAAWTTPTDVSGLLGGDGVADLAMDKTGAAMAVWIQNAPAYGQATWSAAAGWSTPQTAGTDYYQITVAAHPNGGFALAGLGGGVVFYKGYLPDGTFASGVVHTTSVGNDDPAHGSLTLLIGSSLQPFLGWIVPNTAAHPADLDFDAYLAAGRWDIARHVDDKVATGARPHVAQSADTKTIVTTWPRAEGYTPRSAATAIADGIQIGPVYFGGDLAVGADDLQALAMDDAGNAVIVFGTPGVLDPQPVRALRFFAADGIWEQMTLPLFSAPGGASLTSVAAAMTPAGQALVVYALQPASGGAQVYAQTLR